MARKVQSQLLVSEITRDRADALALVRGGEARAEIWRMAIEGDGLAGLERTHAAELERLEALAQDMKLRDRLELARKATEDGYKLVDLEGRKRYPTRK
jgi:hypothetical protein